MAALNFLRNNGRRNVSAIYFNHGTKHGSEAEAFVKAYCSSQSIPLALGRVSGPCPKGESKEAFWRTERYAFFKRVHYSDDFQKHYLRPIVTCHHLDDQVETWLFTSMHGNPRLIPYQRDYFIRPFLLTRKNYLEKWAESRGVPHIFDPSNNDTDNYMRNFIRHEVVPKALRVNPGLHKVVKKKILDQYNKTMDCF